MIDHCPPAVRTGHALPVLPPSPSRDLVLAELASRVFASLPRSDQRRKGLQYLDGLLTVQGRKSIRNIAKLLGTQASEQNLHHFISDSTWDWVPIRRALAEAVDASLPTRAWVVRPMTIPKAGQNSVGVGRHFSPALGQTLNAQRAIGVWATSESAGVPVNWRLQLPSSWHTDDARRSQAAVPEGTSAESLHGCAVEASRETQLGWGLPVRPVVFDLDEASEPLLKTLATTHVPLMARVGGDTLLTVTDRVMSGREQSTLPAHRIMAMAGNMRRPVPGRRPLSGVVKDMPLAAAVRVELPSYPRGSEHRQLVLLGVGDYGSRWPAELWLSNLTTVPMEYLARLRQLTDRAAHDATVVADRVGIRDFTGRSFNGWHRHVTLASAAHAVTVLGDRTSHLPYIAG
ncbi:transposase [Streptomyces sp. WZ.A104]|uniref:IS701 family transposase n=1 Tax=Streptomyces sp. WZ.A104 TaxID=2023771 RepID=UPI00211C65C1|nr:transposase [Streptomyces sp. WZ.A104]